MMFIIIYSNTKILKELLSYTYAYLSEYVLAITIHVIEHTHGSNVRSRFGSSVEQNHGGLVCQM